MIGEDKKLYAVVIGRKNRNPRYVSYCPFADANKPADEIPLAVYLKYSRAQQVRKEILKVCGHKDVHIIRFEAQL